MPKEYYLPRASAYWQPLPYFRMGNNELPIYNDPHIGNLLTIYPLHYQFSATARYNRRGRVDVARKKESAQAFRWLSEKATGYWLWRESVDETWFNHRSIKLFIEREPDRVAFQERFKELFTRDVAQRYSRRPGAQYSSYISNEYYQVYPQRYLLNQAIVCGAVEPYAAAESLRIWTQENKGVSVTRAGIRKRVSTFLVRAAAVEACNHMADIIRELKLYDIAFQKCGTNSLRISDEDAAKIIEKRKALLAVLPMNRVWSSWYQDKMYPPREEIVGVVAPDEYHNARGFSYGRRNYDENGEVQTITLVRAHKKEPVNGCVWARTETVNDAFLSQWGAMIFASMINNTHHLIMPSYKDPVGQKGAKERHPNARKVPAEYRAFVAGKTDVRPGF